MEKGGWRVWGVGWGGRGWSDQLLSPGTLVTSTFTMSPPANPRVALGGVTVSTLRRREQHQGGHSAGPRSHSSHGGSLDSHGQAVGGGAGSLPSVLCGLQAAATSDHIRCQQE